MFYLLSLFLFSAFSLHLSVFSFLFSAFNFSFLLFCISRASACAFTQNRLQRYNKIPTYANLTAFFLRFVCFFRSFPVFSILSLPYPTYPRPSPSPFPTPIPISPVPLHSPFPSPFPFPASLPQYGGWPLFIYAWDVIPRPSPSRSPRPSPFPPSLPQYGGWPLFIYAWDVIPRPSPSHSHPCIPLHSVSRPVDPVFLLLRRILSGLPPLRGRVGVGLSICQVYM